MNRTVWLVLLVAAALLAPMTVGVSQADAFGHRGYGGWGFSCASCYCSPCCTVTYDPCCTSECGWYVGYRPGPVRRMLFGRCCSYYACYPACDATVVSDAPVQDAGYSASSATAVTSQEPTPAEPRMAPDAPPVEPPAADPLDIPEPPASLPGPAPTPLVPPNDLLGPPADAPLPPAAEPPGGGLDFNPLGTEPSDGGGVPLDRPAMPGFEPSDVTIPSFRPSEPSPPAAPPAGPLGKAPTRADSGLLTIYVPYDAEVKINGMLTRSEGSRREYVSYGLKPGFSYEYEIEAQIVRDGQVQSDTRTVVLTAGAIEAVAFGFNTPTTSNVASAR